MPSVGQYATRLLPDTANCRGIGGQCSVLKLSVCTSSVTWQILPRHWGQLTLSCATSTCCTSHITQNPWLRSALHLVTAARKTRTCMLSAFQPLSTVPTTCKQRLKPPLHPSAALPACLPPAATSMAAWSTAAAPCVKASHSPSKPASTQPTQSASTPHQPQPALTAALHN